MDEKNPFKGGTRVGVAVFLTVMLIFVAGYGLGASRINRLSSAPVEQEKLAEISGYLEDYFLFDTDAEAQLEGVYKGLVYSLDDPYSEYMTAEEYVWFLQSAEGELVGVGAIIEQNYETGEVTVVDILPGGPADAAGIQIMDLLVSVDDVKADQLSLEALVTSHILGEAGTMVTLTVYRPSSDQTLTFSVERAKVIFPMVKYEMLENRTGYLQIKEFSDHMPSEFIAAIEALKQQGMEKLLLDLRGNPGGSLNAAVTITDYLLPDFFVTDSGERVRSSIVSLDDKHGNLERYACADGHSVDMPTVILVDGDSASASELFSGALQDYGRGALVGTKTFGKGIAQAVFELSDESALKLTSHQYYTPSGFALHGIGLLPDVPIEYDPDAGEDVPLQAALLTLEELSQGSRTLPVLVEGETKALPPERLLEQAEQQPCKTKHFAFTRQEMEANILQLLSDYGGGAFRRADRWTTDGEWGPEWEITLDFWLDDVQQILFSFDPLTEELHDVEITLPTEQAVSCAIELLEALMPSLSQDVRQTLQEKLPAQPIREDGTLEMIHKQKGLSIYAGEEDGNLTVIIEP